MANHRPGSADPGSISSTLLERVRARRPEAWQRLVDLYGPVVYRWCRQSGVGRDDAADVVQEVFTSVATHVADFRREAPGDSFAAWLGTITRNKVRDWFRRRRGRPEAQGGTDAYEHLLQISECSEPCISKTTSTGGRLDADGGLSHRGLELIRAEFENRTWEAFWRAAIQRQYPADVADDLGISVNAVYKAKSRVLRRLRQELGDLLK